MLPANEIINIIKESPESSNWKLLARSNRKVDAIKALRAFAGIGLKEAKDVYDAYIELYNADALPNVSLNPTYHTLPNGAKIVVYATKSGTFMVKMITDIGEASSMKEVIDMVVAATASQFTQYVGPRG